MAIKLFDGVGFLRVDATKLKAGLKNAQAAAKRAMGGIARVAKTAAKAIAVAFVAAAAAVAAFVALSLKTFADFGDEIQKMALRTGFSTVALSELAFAAKIAGTNITTLETGFKRMSKFMEDARDGLETGTRALEKLGLTIEQLAGASPEEAFETLARALAEVEDANTQAALAQDVFGRAGTRLLPLLKQGADAMRELRDEAHSLGIVMSQDAANAGAELTDAFLRMSESVRGIFLSLGDALAPAFTQILDGAKVAFAEIRRFVDQNREGFAAIGSALVDLARAVSERLAGAFQAFGTDAEGILFSVARAIDTVAQAVRSLSPEDFRAAGRALGEAFGLGFGDAAIGAAKAALRLILDLYTQQVRVIMDLFRREAGGVEALFRSGGGVPGLGSAAAQSMSTTSTTNNTQTVQRAEFNIRLPDGSAETVRQGIGTALLDLQRVAALNRGAIAFVP